MGTKSLIVVLSLLAMVDRSLAVSCVQCPNPSVCGPPPTCSFGTYQSTCSCCDNNECAKGPGEECGGQWNFGGTCGMGLECQYQYKEWDADGSGVFPVDNSRGLCSNKSGPGEQCGKLYGIGGEWANEYGTCESGLECQQEDQKDDRRILPPGICSTLVPDGCKDDSLNCALNAYQCKTNTYVQGLCRKTCGLCGVSSVRQYVLLQPALRQYVLLQPAVRQIPGWIPAGSWERDNDDDYYDDDDDNYDDEDDEDDEDDK